MDTTSATPFQQLTADEKAARLHKLNKTMAKHFVKKAAIIVAVVVAGHVIEKKLDEKLNDNQTDSE